MPQLPDLVNDTKLTTVITDPITIHSFDDSEENNARPTRRSECWKNKKHLGKGGFGDVWLQQTCEASGQTRLRPSLRAVKVMQHSKLREYRVNYVNELLAIAKFSQKKVSSFACCFR